jgi:hypothetical protein
MTIGATSGKRGHTISFALMARWVFAGQVTHTTTERSAANIGPRRILFAFASPHGSRCDQGGCGDTGGGFRFRYTAISDPMYV